MQKPEKKIYVKFLCGSLASKLNKTVSDSNYIVTVCSDSVRLFSFQIK